MGLLVVSTVLAGCLSEGDLDLEVLQAPAWEAGYQWTYGVEARGSHTFEGEDGRATQTFEYETDLNMTVFNTTRDIDGTPVYYVDNDGGLSDDFMGADLGLFGRSQIVAVEQTSLRPVARGWDYGWGECNQVEMYPTEEPGILPFPMLPGETWVTEEDDLRIEGEVVGVEVLETPAGTFDTIHLRLVMTPIEEGPEPEPSPDIAYSDVDMPEEEEEFREELISARIQQDYYYSPVAKNLVRTVTNMHVEFREGDEHFTITGDTVIDLIDLDLTADAESPAPSVRTDRMERMFRNIQIVSDTELPYNVADGATTARLGVQIGDGAEMARAVAVDSGHHTHDASAASYVEEPASMSVVRPEGIAFVESVPDAADYDHELYELHWTLHPYRGGEAMQFVQDVVEIELDALEAYSVSAELRSKPDLNNECEGRFHPMWIAGAWGEIRTMFEKSYEIDVETGEAHDILLDIVPIDAYGQIVANWDVDHSPLTQQTGDNARPVFDRISWEDDLGYGVDGFYESWFAVDDSDRIQILWRAEGPEPVSGLDSPVVAGHTAVLDVYLFIG